MSGTPLGSHPPRLVSSLLGVGAALAASLFAAEAPAAPTPTVDQPEVVRALSRAFAATARAVRTSVVRVEVRHERAPAADPAPGGQPSRIAPPDEPATDSPLRSRRLGGNGSGVIVDPGGLVVTNRHVVRGASGVSLMLDDGRTFAADLIGEDRRSDLALLRMRQPPPDLTHARLGNSDQVEVGQWVLAMGCPLGLGPVVTVGIVSGRGVVGRQMGMTGDRVRDYLQTDAKINPGNSGGPLVNLDGEVIGINTLIRSGSGGAYGFAVPANEVKRVTEGLLRDGRVRYPYLGVRAHDLQRLDPAARQRLGLAAAQAGVYVQQVAPDSPAARAGLQAGDLIVAFGGEPVKFAEDFRAAVSARPIGAQVELVYVRLGRQYTARIAVGEPPRS